jgi:predicted dehydrogenase
MRPVGIAVVGAGPWGRTLAGAFARVESAEIRWICELDPDRRAQAAAHHPRARVTARLDEALADPAVVAVAAAVDTARHHAVGVQVLEANRHLLLEKPMALSVSDATELHDLAKARARVLTVGHLLLHHPAIRRARQILSEGLLGDPLYFEATRIAPGTARAGESAWWTLAPHDVSLALHLLDAMPTSVGATGGACVIPGRENVAFATLHFPGGRLAHIDVARIAAEKQRRFSIAGTRRALTFDELTPERPLRLVSTADGVEQNHADIVPVDTVDPLFAQCLHFVGCASRQDTSGGNAAHALAVTRILEAGARSMLASGAPIEVA